MPFRQVERSEASSTTTVSPVLSTSVPDITTESTTSVPETTTESSTVRNNHTSTVPNTVKRKKPCTTTLPPKILCSEKVVPTVPTTKKISVPTTRKPVLSVTTFEKVAATTYVPRKRLTEVPNLRSYTVRNTPSTKSYRYFWNERNGWDRYEIGYTESFTRKYEVPLYTVPTTSKPTHSTKSSPSVPFTEFSVATVPPMVGNTPVPDIKIQENDRAVMLAYGLGIGTGCIPKILNVRF